MPIDINLLRADRGGDPDLVRESQRRRFASVELVDQVRKEKGEGTGHIHKDTHTHTNVPTHPHVCTHTRTHMLVYPCVRFFSPFLRC
jgi:hypothetical protein